MAAAQKVGTDNALDHRALKLPNIPELVRVPRRMQGEDENELRWFLDDPPVAGIIARGGFGAMLERAEAFGYGALPCRKCGGTWRARRRRKDGSVMITNWRDGTGRRPKKHFGVQETYATALARYRVAMRRELRIVIVSHHADPAMRAAIDEAFRARGERAMTDAELRELFPALPDGWTTECKPCQGIGIVSRRLPTHAEVTAWPTGSSKRSGALEARGADELVERSAGRASLSDGYAGVSLGELERYLAVDVLLRDVAELAPIARVALEEYYGPEIARGNHGRLAYRQRREASGFEALWPFTSVPNATMAVDKGRRMREAEQLYSFGCSVFNLCAYGAGA